TLVTVVVLLLNDSPLRSITLGGVTLVTLSLFALLALHAARRDPRHAKSSPMPHTPRPRYDPSSLVSPVSSVSSLAPAAAWGKILVALALTLGGVVIMVQTGQAVAADVHLPSAFFSLVVLAVATSLPNTVVAYQLARTHRDVAAVEEILSSNGVNLALGSA